MAQPLAVEGRPSQPAGPPIALSGQAPDSLRIVGESASMRELRDRITVAAACDEPVLVVGETGTGKELVARAIHTGSRRAGKPLSIVNCAAIAPELIAAELFGHVAGAFTGAKHSRDGRLRAAGGSSIFLDEISATSNEFQVALLRAVEYGEVQPVGADGPAQRVDVRHIAASNMPLRELSDGAGLRLDLMCRLAGFVIEVPPLRDRQEDIPALVGHFLAETCEQYGASKRLSDGAVDRLVRGTYLGNVRELRQAVRRGFAASEGEMIRRRHLDAPFAGTPTAAPTRSPTGAIGTQRSRSTPFRNGEFLLRPVIRCQIVRALTRAKGNISKSARLLDIPRSTLQHYLTKYRINIDPFRPDTTGAEASGAETGNTCRCSRQRRQPR